MTTYPFGSCSLIFSACSLATLIVMNSLFTGWLICDRCSSFTDASSLGNGSCSSIVNEPPVKANDNTEPFNIHCGCFHFWWNVRYNPWRFSKSNGAMEITILYWLGFMSINNHWVSLCDRALKHQINASQRFCLPHEALSRRDNWRLELK